MGSIVVGSDKPLGGNAIEFGLSARKSEELDRAPIPFRNLYHAPMFSLAGNAIVTWLAKTLRYKLHQNRAAALTVTYLPLVL